MQKNIDEFTKEIGLTEEQSSFVKRYILELVVDNLKLMQEEYNQEVNTVIDSLKGIEEKK